MITPKNVLQHELIGLQVKIKGSTDGTLRGIEGKVIDETQNTFTIRTGNEKEIMVAKKGQEFIFILPGSTHVKIIGNALLGDPIDRLKKKQPKKWE